MKRLIVAILLFASQVAYCNEYFDKSSELMIGFYREIMSPVKSPVSSCQFEPSCSEFASEAVREYGFGKGVLLAADRWMRCSGGHADPSDYPYSRRKFIDSPLQNYLFGKGHLWRPALAYGNAGAGRKDDGVDTIFAFPYSLFKKNDYASSSLELKRISFYSKSPLVKSKAEMLVALNEFMMRNKMKAFDLLRSSDTTGDRKSDFNLFALTYLTADEMNLNAFNINSCESAFAVFKDTLIIKLKAYSEFKETETESLKKTLLRISDFGENYNIASVLNFVDDNIDRKSKYPWLAGTMSAVLPGSGYIYCGRVKEGLSAFLVNGLLGLGIYELFKNHNTGSGVLTSMVAFPFYLGNILGSSNAAMAVNDRIKTENIIKFRKILRIEASFSLDRLDSFWK